MDCYFLTQSNVYKRRVTLITTMQISGDMKFDVSRYETSSVRKTNIPKIPESN